MERKIQPKILPLVVADHLNMIAPHKKAFECCKYTRIGAEISLIDGIYPDSREGDRPLAKILAHSMIDSVPAISENISPMAVDVTHVFDTVKFMQTKYYSKHNIIQLFKDFITLGFCHTKIVTAQSLTDAADTKYAGMIRHAHDRISSLADLTLMKNKRYGNNKWTEKRIDEYMTIFGQAVERFGRPDAIEYIHVIASGYKIPEASLEPDVTKPLQEMIQV